MKDITAREEYLAYIAMAAGMGASAICGFHWILGIIFLVFFIVGYIHFYFKYLK